MMIITTEMMTTVTLSIYHVPVTVLSILYVVTDLIFKVTLQRRYYYHSHFRDEKMEARRCLVIHPRTHSW